MKKNKRRIPGFGSEINFCTRSQKKSKNKIP